MKLRGAALVLAVCLLPRVFANSDCENECYDGSTCEGLRICSCPTLGEKVQLVCENNLIQATLGPDTRLKVECGEGMAPSEYETLAGLRAENVEDVEFWLCPLPDVPVSELLASFGIASINTLRFQSGYNMSSAFERKCFTGLGNVTNLLLPNNNLTELPEDFLREFPQLARLDLQENNLRLPSGFFRWAPRLVFLELGNNRMQLDPPRFSDLGELLVLNLWKNGLRNLTRSSFSGLRSLQNLDVSSNLMTSLPSDVFRGLKNLVRLNLSSNNFTRLPQLLLAENEHLEYVHLHDNRQTLSLPDFFLANMTKLREVHLMRSNIISVPENVFWGSGAIINVSLRENALVELPQLLFRDQRNLEKLDLAENLIAFLPDNVFKRLTRLKTLNLSSNRIKRINRKSLHGTYSLLELDVKGNGLNFVDGQSLVHLTELKTADFSHNRLSFLPEGDPSSESFSYRDRENRSPFEKCLSLERLVLSNNSISEMFSDWRLLLVKLQILNLADNEIENLATSDVQFLGDDLTVDLRRNRISTISLRELENLALSQSTTTATGQEEPERKRVVIQLEDNPLNCDCRTYDFFRYLESALHRAVYRLVTLDPGDLTCKLPTELFGRSVKNVNLGELTCLLDAGHDCPDGCRCSLRRHDWALVVNCTRSGLTEIPGFLPRVTSANHTELLLDNNRIGKLPNSTFPGYESVTHLHLSSNNISDIGTGMLSYKLQVLTLDDNNLTALGSGTVKFLSESPGIRLLTLHNNPWKCDCSARDLLDLIQQKFKQIPHLSNVTCSEGKEPLSKLSVSDLCPVSTAVIVSCIAAAVFGLLVGMLAALYYRYQREVKVWLYSRRLCLWFVTEEELDRDKLYDAFVSYSHKDEAFVVNTLVPELESGENPFKLCLHYRDWIAGEWIPNQIAHSVENSRRTLVVLSPNFLESVWSRMEFRAAHKQALSEGRARVIVVLYGDVGPTDDLDPELKAYISMNTYVKWGDPWFWRKLRYALPHPPSLARTNLGFVRRRSIGKEKNRLDDKLELIHTLHVSGSPPGGTTPPADVAPNGNPIRAK